MGTSGTDRPRRRSAAEVAAPAARYRPELQGLRALAVALVVVHHVWSGRVSGGVDVFFLLTGFLLTGGLVRAATRGPLDVRDQWRRSAARLLPTTTVVLLVTAAAAVVLLPQGRWLQTVREIASSVLFVQNWRLAADAVDYAARSDTASVVQHFWSLSVQGQVALGWPALVAVVALATRGADLRSRLTLTLLALGAASLVCSVTMTLSAAPAAYFHTLTRLWEFALGGLLALWIDRIALPRGRRVLLGWVGVLGLVACGAVLPGAAVFPGIAALWPTGCAALVLVAGVTGTRYGADRLLTAGPVRRVGDLAFSLYLWHWPVLVLYLASTGAERAGVLAGLGVIAGSVALASVTHHVVERPAGLRVGAAGLVAVLLAAGTWHIVATQRVAAAMPGGPDHPGARALTEGGTVNPAVAPIPPMVAVTEDWVRIEHWDCAPMAGFPMDVCTQPVDFTPQRQIWVVGDSHVQQFAAALIPGARERGWQLTAIVRGACPFSAASEVVPDEAECLAWNDAALAEIARGRPDAVVTLASRDVRPGPTEITPPGFVQRWTALDALGIPVVAVRDNPRFDFSPPDCLQRRGRAAPECGVSRADVYAPDPPWTGLDVPGNVAFLDLTDQLCDAQRCPAEIGNVLIYMDDNHVTASYGATMADAAGQRISDALGW